MARRATIDQFRATKANYAEVILLFRMGDYFESYEDDAKTTARALNLTLCYDDIVPMTFVPVKSSEVYLKQLLQMGYRVAICEPTAAPA